MRREVQDGVFVCPLFHLEGGFGPGQRFAAGDELLNIVDLVFRGAFRDCWPQVNLRLASFRGLPCRFPAHPRIALSAALIEASGSSDGLNDWTALMHVLSLTYKFPRSTPPFPQPFLVLLSPLNSATLTDWFTLRNSSHLHVLWGQHP